MLKNPLLSIFMTTLIGSIGLQSAWSAVIGLPLTAPSFTGKNQHQPLIRYDSVWADKTGATHVTACRIEGLDFKSYAPPAAPQWIGISPDKIESIAYAILPPHYVGTWHSAPGPQWVISLSGQWSVETTDGTVLTHGPGQMQFNADGLATQQSDGRIGHLTRTVGDVPNVQLIIKLKPDTKRDQLSVQCPY